MSAESHLSLFGVSVEQANDFILSHVTEPQAIFDAASQLGIPTSMLSELSSYSTDVISKYFTAAGFDSLELDQGSFAGTRELISMETIEFYSDHVVFNTNAGTLSTESLRESAIAATNAENYFTIFDPVNFKGADDGIFTSEELGIAQLGDIPATTETIESLFYGTGINVFQSVDLDEARQLAEFFYSTSFLFGSDSEAVSLMLDILSDPANEPFFSNPQIELFLVDAVVYETDTIGIDTGVYFFEEALILI